MRFQSIFILFTFILLLGCDGRNFGGGYVPPATDDNENSYKSEKDSNRYFIYYSNIKLEDQHFRFDMEITNNSISVKQSYLGVLGEFSNLTTNNKYFETIEIVNSKAGKIGIQLLDNYNGQIIDCRLYYNLNLNQYSVYYKESHVFDISVPDYKIDCVNDKTLVTQFTGYNVASIYNLHNAKLINNSLIFNNHTLWIPFILKVPLPTLTLISLSGEKYVFDVIKNF